MLSTWQASTLFSRTVSKQSVIAGISEWVLTCRCSIQISNRHCHMRNEGKVSGWEWPLRSKNYGPGKYLLLGREKKLEKGNWSHCFQQNSKYVVQKDLQWKTEGEGWASESHLSVKSLVRSSENSVGNGVAAEVKYKSYSKMRSFLRLSHLSHSHLRHGIFADHNARHIHTLLNLKNGKGYKNPGHIILKSQNVVDRKVAKRFKTSHPFFKKLAVFFFKEKDLEAKVKKLKKLDEERLKKEAEVNSSLLESDAEKLQEKENAKRKSTATLSNLIYGCLSSKHLLDLIVPWIENKAVSIDDTVKCIEHLNSLLYGEIMEQYPDLPYGSVALMYYNLTLLRVEGKVFRTIHSHFTFQTLITYLEQNAESLSKNKFGSCFSCLTHLGVSHLDPVMTKFYMRIMNGDEEGYSMIDIVNLYNAVKSHNHSDLVIAAYVLPKLRQCLRVMDGNTVDVDTFQALVYLAEKLQYGLKGADEVSLYSCIYKASLETDCLDDLNCACELAFHLRIFNHKELPNHKKYVIQTLSDLCLQKLEERTGELSPLKIMKLKPSLFRSSYRTRMNMRSRVEYFLKKRINELTLPELIWLLAVPGHAAVSKLEPEVISAIRSKFRRLDLPNLFLTFLFLEYSHLQDPVISELIAGKTLEHLREIFQNEKVFHIAIRFYSRSWSTFGKYLNKEFELAFQNAMLETYLNSYYGLMGSFASYVLMILPRFHSLQLPVLHMLNEISKQDVAFQYLPSANLFFLILHSASSKSFQNSQKDDNFLYNENRSLYDTVSFRIYYMSLAELYRRRNMLDLFLLIKNFSMVNHKMDFLIKSVALEKISKSPLQSMSDFRLVCRSKFIMHLLEINEGQKKMFLNNVVTFALEHKEFFMFKDWRETVNFLDGCKYSVGDDDKDLQDLLQTVINHEFTVDDNFCKFVNQCSSLGLDVSRALKAIFSVEYLTTADQLIADKVLKEDYMKKALCLLNQRVCISYPALNVPWFQERDDVLRTYSNQNHNRNT
ncbi:uncharacterized protein LOC123548973 isoform X3 [Mercenaria mercenaria]|uniref:uncharacterized protein LOC123548973 isoform X3 n=1 Tax=Mercenaria mercenaria TaxID=6596 RepID=UPI00234E4803|nr:uncharacterized protein LOC123548973 isoform X3 [Mercenaria mercenaria]